MLNKLKQEVLTTNIIENGKARELKIIYYKKINNLNIFCTNDNNRVQCFDLDLGKKKIGIICISHNIIKEVNEQCLEIYATMIAVKRYLKIMNPDKEINDNIVDGLTAKICGYNNTILALNELTRFVNNIDAVYKRVDNLEYKLMQDSSRLDDEVIKHIIEDSNLLR